jgi:hypothetical protein
MRPAPTRLDFIIIGAMKSGTTSLWEHLRTHPQICMPGTKEEPFFSVEGRYRCGLKPYLAELFPDLIEGVLAGKATPQYMMGSQDAILEVVASRIAAAFPDLKLMVLLRDPIERAISKYRHHLRKGFESRPLDETMTRLIEEGVLKTARRVPKGTNTYVTNGEYGRILDTYLAFFRRDQLFVAFTADLEEHPAELLASTFEFLGVDPSHRPPSLATRFHKGGTGRRESDDAIDQLKAYLEENVWRRLPEGGRAEKHAFHFWLQNFWNVEPDEREKELSPDVRAALAAHYERDAEALAVIAGRPLPWAGSLAAAE